MSMQDQRFPGISLQDGLVVTHENGKQTFWRAIASNPSIGLITLARHHEPQGENNAPELIYVYQRNLSDFYRWLLDNVNLMAIQTSHRDNYLHAEALTLF